MNSEITGYDILDQYRAISSKLKKRFFRKPNETEVSESFANLAQQCESQELHPYAGLSWTAAARCEGTLGNSVSESSYLLKAGKQYLLAEENDLKIGCITAAAENLQAGLSCYAHAATKFPENSLIPVGLNIEIADFLKRINRPELIETYLKSALECNNGKIDTSIHCYDLLASHFLSLSDHVSALQTYQEIFKLLESLPENGYRCEILLKCEINSVFLLLILRPSPQNIPTNLAKILEKYTWGDQNDDSIQACRMSEHLFLLMECLVTICQSLDKSALQDLEFQFWRFLSYEQKDLLRTLVKAYYL